MKTKNILISLILLIGVTTSVQAQNQIDLNKYLWEYPSFQNVNAPPDMIEFLREEVQKILDTGFLRPLSIRYADVLSEWYFLYREPARVLQTLAEAYPFLTPAQQTAVKNYVQALFQDEEQHFWYQPSYSNRVLPLDYGVTRTLYPQQDLWVNVEWWGQFRPNIFLIYHAWNYIYRTGDSTLLLSRYEDIRDFYQYKLDINIDPGNLYGTMCAHIGMARLAYMVGDQNTLNLASNRLLQELVRGLDMKLNDSLAYYGLDGWNAPYPEMSTTGWIGERNENYVYKAFNFLHLSPEIGRYLKDHLQAQVLARHQHGLTILPYWWVVDAPHFTRWAGDESVGIPTEMFGMIIPIEMWVKQTSGAELEKYFISSPKGIGDHYWLENYVLAIEAFGTPVWQDVRSNPFFVTFGGTAPQIVQQPQSLTIAEGETATFTIQATGTGTLQYLWTTPKGQISTGTSNTLTINQCSLSDAGQYTCTVSNEFGSVTSQSATLTVYRQQLIESPAGWGGISSYLNPLTSDVVTLLSPISNQLVILYNQTQIYWPSQQINTIGNWNPFSGYVRKYSGNVSFSFPGLPVENPAISLSSGWNLIPVLNECDVPIGHLENGLGNSLILIKEIAGTGIHWPGFGISSLSTLKPGNAYWVLTGQASGYTFPGCNP